MQNKTIIECKQIIPGGLHFDYQGNALDLECCHGEFISIIGPNYCGKAQWLKTICGLEDQQSGEVYIHGINTLNLTADEWKMTRMKVAYIHADTALLSAANGLINTIAPAIYHQLDLKNKNQILAEKALDLLEEIDPQINLDELPAYISKEHRFKIAVARAIMLEPDVLVLNNPFAHFNKDSKTLFQAFLANQIKKGLSLLTVTHDIHYALNSSDKIIFLDRNNLHQFNSKQATLNCGIPIVDEFLAFNT
jgi:ABC-type transporter Mla maintaining outer membrane lipid asymmetry ATPase subunit MlaF